MIAGVKFISTGNMHRANIFRRSLNFVVMSHLLCWASSSSHADLFVPPGLNPGDTYHLAFKTTGTRDATSSLIADYNNFVNVEANLPGAVTASFGIQWFAIASTSSIDARSNTSTDPSAALQAPIFLLSGTKLADDYVDLWDGSIDALFVVDQFNHTGTTFNWTGTLSSGVAAPFYLGHPTTARDGNANSLTGWVSWASIPEVTASLPFYAVSEKLTAPSAIPEPAPWLVWLCLSSVLLLVGTYRRISG